MIGIVRRTRLSPTAGCRRRGHAFRRSSSIIYGFGTGPAPLGAGVGVDPLTQRARTLEAIAIKLWLIRGPEGVVMILDSSKPPLATGDLVLELRAKRFGADAENGVVRLREILGLRSKSKKDARLIAAFHRTGFFDAAYCLANNPDVAANGIGPALHFTQRGWKEGRKPGPRFDQCISNWVRFAKPCITYNQCYKAIARFRDPGNYPNIS
jgi:hypothetical protein